jgi:hypothetical protein
LLSADEIECSSTPNQKERAMTKRNGTCRSAMTAGLAALVLTLTPATSVLPDEQRPRGEDPQYPRGDDVQRPRGADRQG